MIFFDKIVIYEPELMFSEVLSIVRPLYLNIGTPLNLIEVYFKFVYFMLVFSYVESKFSCFRV